MSSSPSHGHGCLEKKHWWLTNKKIAVMYVRDARSLIASQQHLHTNIASALNLLDAALALSPTFDMALELKAVTLLRLRRFKEVADMLQDYIPSLQISSSDDDSSFSSLSDNYSQPLSRERLKLLSKQNQSSSFTCFSVVSDLKKKLMAGLGGKPNDLQLQWRYLVLGQACSHLGLMEDAMALLQTGKRLASAAFRRESVCWSDDNFAASVVNGGTESICHLLSHIKLLLRRKTAAIAASEAGLYCEAIRHFSKIVDGRRGAPQGFLAECYMHRAAAYRCCGRIAEAIADCNRTLALDPCNMEALSSRASMFESIHCVHESLHDLEHLKLLYNSMLRDRKKRQKVVYREIPGKLCGIGRKIEELKERIGSGENETVEVDYFALMGLRRGCSRAEVERAYLLLTLRHKPDKCTSFVEKCEFEFEFEGEIKDRAKMSGLLLYRLIQRGYTSVMKTLVSEEEEAEKRRKAEEEGKKKKKSAYQGVFCRDLGVVGNLLSKAGFNRPIPMKYEALSC